MRGTDRSPSGSDTYRALLRKKRLTYGLAASILAVPIGLLLKMPTVWGLAIVGIIVAGIKLWMQEDPGRKQESSHS